MATRKKFSKQEERLTAYHEAGHAVAFYLFGKKIKSITIIPNYEQGAYGYTKPTGGKFIPVHRFSDAPSVLEARLDFERMVIISFAGYVAEIKSRYKGDTEISQLNLLRPGITVKLKAHDDPTGDGDLNQVRVLFSAFNIYRLYSFHLNHPQQQNEDEFYFRWLWVRAINIITEEVAWQAVESLAAALLEHKKLTGRQVHKILESSKLNQYPAQFHGTLPLSKGEESKGAKKRGQSSKA